MGCMPRSLPKVDKHAVMMQTWTNVGSTSSSRTGSARGRSTGKFDSFNFMISVTRRLSSSGNFFSSFSTSFILSLSSLSFSLCSLAFSFSSNFFLLLSSASFSLSNSFCKSLSFVSWSGVKLPDFTRLRLWARFKAFWAFFKLSLAEFRSLVALIRRFLLCDLAFWYSWRRDLTKSSASCASLLFSSSTHFLCVMMAFLS
mmetsp:Transcript_9981/g.18835  ORF Transcript_9981/g.18835 Transcript_9981/m.18835 type:complete len:200 (-) Transcript_9981:2043-2642(-)